MERRYADCRSRIQLLIARMLKGGVGGAITVKTEAAEIRRRTPVWVSGQHVGWNFNSGNYLFTTDTK